MSTSVQSLARHCAGLSCLALLGLAPAAHAAVGPLDTFSARLGGYISSFDTEIRADGTTVSGTPVDLDRDLGVDNNGTLGLIGLTWRPWEHHEFALNYYRSDNSGDRTLQRDVVFRDQVFQANAVVRTDFDVDAYELSYTWWAALHENWALGPRVGVAWYSVDMQVALQADVNGNAINGAISREVNTDLPAPTLGGAWRWTPAPDWRISADAGYFTANINDIDADVTFARIGVGWYPWENVGFTLDYVRNHIKADADTNSFTGNFDFTDSGLQAGVVYRF